MAQPNSPISFIRPAESANGRLSVVQDNCINIELETEPGIGSSQWFHVGIDATAGTQIRLINAGASTYPIGWTDRLIWSQTAGTAWQPLQTDLQNGIVEFTHLADGLIHYALFPPYTLQHFNLLLEGARKRSDVDIMEYDPASNQAPRISLGDRDPQACQIWLLAGQHGGEHPAMWFADGFIDALLNHSELPRGIRFHIVPVVNLHGMKSGYLRANAAGQDPNRHWDDPSACREIDDLFSAMTTTGVDVLIDVHNDCETEYVYFDVLDEWMNTPPQLIAIRENFEQHLAERSPAVVFGKRYPWQSAPHRNLLAKMCAPAIERYFGAAAITLELPIGRYRDTSDTQHIWTPQNSRELGKEAVAIMLKIHLLDHKVLIAADN